MHTLRLPASMESLEAFRTFVLEKVEALGVSPEVSMKLELALEELLTNVIHYAYGDNMGDVEVGCSLQDDGGMQVTLTDWGVAFDPLAQESPDLALSLAEREVGGLGIFLVKKLVHDLHYERRDDSNVLTFVFRFFGSMEPACQNGTS